MHLELPTYLSRVLVYFDLFLLSCFSFHGGAARAGNESDQLALLQFKAKINDDPLGILNSWNQSLPFCQWHGVNCGRRRQRVVAVELGSSKLVGSISPHLGNLSFLRLLDLSNNSFGNEIPPEIWNLDRLESLQLANNSIADVIPSNMSCSTNLQVLDLGGNLLFGEIPNKLSCFSCLRQLRLYNNKLTGQIPASVGNLSSLQVLSLASNNMTGLVPESLGQLKNLNVFFIADNGFSGSVPSSIFNLSKLSTFGAALNQFEGTLPADLGTKMPHIEVIFIPGNRFTGSIPPSLSNATHLRVFVAGDNNFTGTLPSLHKLINLKYFTVLNNHVGSGAENDLSFICSLMNATNMEILALGTNNFGGVIPECIGNLSTDLRVLTLEKNKLSGKIPLVIGNLINLEWLSLQDNQLSGHIPSNIGSLEKLQVFYFNANQLWGSIPFSFGNLNMLTKLAMGENNLEGSIPPSLGECRSLIWLDISENKLSGLIPPQLFNLSPFSVGMNLSRNCLSGNIPSQVGKLKNIGTLDVSGNLLSGEIPSSLGLCESLEILDMSGNLYQGIIPSSLGLLRGLQLLNLSKNKLTGEIPRFLVSLKSLNILDLSHNDFEGLILSQGIFLNASAVSLAGNNKLCGGILELHLPKCNFHGSNKSWKKVLLITLIILGVTLLVFIMLSCWLRRKGNKSASSESPYQFMELSYHTLFRATNGFSSASLIGAGSFGSVYKGVLDEGNKLVAIKVFNLLQQGASGSFITECEALRNVRHRNVVKILTVCSSIDHQGNDFKALVYELMTNGSLDEWLHQKPMNLNLLQRLGIAIDVACALDYLHNQCMTPIVHCDLKPSNVLLDDDMTAHLGDFGLVRFTGIARGSLQNEMGSIGVKGSIGYTAPEYGMGAKASTSGDVYSYGVLLLEMFTGKRPTDEIFQDGLNIHQFANGVLSENVWEIIDPTLMANLLNGNRRFQRIQECLMSIIGIGLTCSAELPRERMNMGDVVVQLSLVKDKLLKTGVHRMLQNLVASHDSTAD